MIIAKFTPSLPQNFGAIPLASLSAADELKLIERFVGREKGADAELLEHGDALVKRRARKYLNRGLTFSELVAVGTGQAVNDVAKAAVNAVKKAQPSRYKKLNAQQLALIRTIRGREASMAEKEAAKDKLLVKCTGLIKSIAKKVYRGRLELEDLFQEGSIGLFKAVNKFRFKKGKQFSTYATWWIHQSMQRAVSDTGRPIRIPVHMEGSISKYKKVVANSFQKKGRKPEDASLMDKMEIDAEKLACIQRTMQLGTVSLERPIGEDKVDVLASLIENRKSPNPLENCQLAELKHEVRLAVESLENPKQRKILTLLFGLNDKSPLSLEETAKKLRIQPELVLEHLGQALEKLKLIPALQDYSDFSRKAGYLIEC